MTRHRSWKEALGSRDFSGDGPSSTQRKLARLLVAFAAAAILFCGLFPFDLSLRDPGNQISHRFDWSFSQFFTSGDTFENILFFMPLGFALAALLMTRPGKEIPAGAGTVAIAAGVSTTVELLQCFLAERDPSLTDLINNTLGGAAGFGIYLWIGAKLMQWTARRLEIIEDKLGAGMISAITGVFAVGICALPLLMGMDAGKLHSWNPNYGLALGNEIGADRAWLGTIRNVVVASRAADRSQTAALLSDRDPFEIFGDSLLAWYDPVGEPPFADRAGRNAPLELASRAATQPMRPRRPKTDSHAPTFPLSATQPARAATSRALPIDLPSPDSEPWPLGHNTWVQTLEPADEITRTIAISNEFTLALTASSARVDQYRGARLFTISAGSENRNLMFGQDGANLIVRIRSSATGQNADSPEFVLEDVFLDSKPKRIVATFQDSELHVYAGDFKWHASVRLTPESAVIWTLYPRSYWKFQMNSADIAIIALIYRAIVFLPLGALAAITVNQFTRTFKERWMIAGAIAVGTIILLESLLTTLGNEPLRVSCVVVALASAAIGIAAVKIKGGSAWRR